jgi:transposase-like protein
LALNGDAAAIRSDATAGPLHHVASRLREERGEVPVEVSKAVATGVTADGRREVLGFDVGDLEDGAFWTAFLRSLWARGLGGNQL